MDCKNKFEKTVQEINCLQESGDTKYTPFSLLDPNLSFEELERKQILYTYSQAQVDNREAEFKEYEEKYTQAFSEIYDLYKEYILFDTSIWVLNDHTSSLKWDYVLTREADDEDLKHNVYLYFPKSKDEYLNYIINNCREVNPASDIYIATKEIYISFNYDLKFRVYFLDEFSNTYTTIKNIFTNHGFYQLETGYKKDDDE